MKKYTIKSFFFGSHLGCHIVSRLSYKLSANNKVTFVPFYACNNLNLVQQSELRSLYDVFISKVDLTYKNGGHLKNGRHLGYYVHLHVMSGNYKCFIVEIDTSTSFKEKFIANDIQLNRLYMKTGRHFEIQDGGRQGAFLAWH